MIPLRRCSAAGSFLLYNLSIRGIARDADAPPAVKPVIQNQPHRKFHQRRNRRGIALRRFALDGENSIILVTLAAFSIFCAVKSDKPFVNIAVPVVAAVVLIANGTMTCYMSIFVIFSLMPRASMEVSIQSLVSS